MSEPTAVEITLSPRTIPDERIDTWTEEFDDSMESSQSSSPETNKFETILSVRQEYDILDEYLESKAIEWTKEQFVNAQGHNSVHHWIDGYEVSFDG